MPSQVLQHQHDDPWEPVLERQVQREEARAQRLVVHELAAERVAELEAELAAQRSAQQALAAAARRAQDANEALRHEAASLREGKALLEFKLAALQARLLLPTQILLHACPDSNYLHFKSACPVQQSGQACIPSSMHVMRRSKPQPCRSST